MPLAAPRTARVLFDSGFRKDEFRVSPDGNWIAYNSLESGRWDLHGPLFQTSIRVDPVRDQYAVTRDGERFILTEPAGPENPFTVMLNWHRQ